MSLLSQRAGPSTTAANVSLTSGKTLQEAIDDGTIGGGGAVLASTVTNDSGLPGTNLAETLIAIDADKLDATGNIAQSQVTGLVSALSGKLAASLLGSASGIAQLGADGKVPSAQLSITGATYKGTWNATTNSPTLAAGVGTNGDFYRVATAGTQSIGQGSTAYSVGDAVVYNSTSGFWERIGTSQTVTSVFGRSGAITKASGDYATSDITGISTYAQTVLDDTDAATMRGTLGLGAAATRAIGTTAGTVPDGADSRFITTSTFLNSASAGGTASTALAQTEVAVGSVTITPTSSTSKVQVHAALEATKDTGTTARTVVMRIRRGVTNTSPQVGQDRQGLSQPLASTKYSPPSFSGIDSPATAAAVTYTLYAVVLSAGASTAARYELTATELRASGPSTAAQSTYTGTATGSVQRTVADKLGELISVKDFGAVGDGTTNDLAALTAASVSAYTLGHDLHIPRGIYRVTGSWVIGPNIVQTIANTIADSYGSNYNPTNETAAKSLYRPRIHCDSGAILWGDFTPGSLTPILDWQLAENDNNPAMSGGLLDGLTIVGKGGYVGGALVSQDANGALTSVLQCGLHWVRGLSKISNVACRELYYGMASAAAYWTEIENPRVHRSQNCVYLYNFNAGSIRRLLMTYSNVGLVIDGANWSLSRIETENVAEDVWIKTGDASRWDGGYLEDGTTASGQGSGKYAIKLGKSNDANDVLHTSIANVRVGALGLSGTLKKSILVRGFKAGLFDNCRVYGKAPQLADGSYGGINLGDFDVSGAGWHWFQAGGFLRPNWYATEPLSLSHFGGVGDGTTDNAAAWTLAWTYTKRVRVPTGTFASGTVITVPTGGQIIGDGSVNSKLAALSTNDLLDLGGNNGNNILIAGVRLQNTATGGHLVVGANFYYESAIERCELWQSNPAKSCVKLTGGGHRLTFRELDLSVPSTATVPGVDLQSSLGFEQVTFERITSNALMRVMTMTNGDLLYQIVFRQIRGNNPLAGLIDLGGCDAPVIEDVEYSGLAGTNTADIIRLRRGFNATVAETGSNTSHAKLARVRRIGGSLAGGTYDIQQKHQFSTTGHVYEQCGHPSSTLTLKDGYKGGLLIGSRNRVALQDDSIYQYMQLVDPSAPMLKRYPGAPDEAPDFVGQQAVNTSNGNFYVGKATASSADFHLVTTS